jgi:hypothetical protein
MGIHLVINAEMRMTSNPNTDASTVPTLEVHGSDGIPCTSSAHGLYTRCSLGSGCTPGDHLVITMVDGLVGHLENP